MSKFLAGALPLALLAAPAAPRADAAPLDQVVVTAAQPSTAFPAAPNTAEGVLRIGHPWSLPFSAGAPTAAGYLTVTNIGKAPDRLLGADSPVFDHVEIHEMKMDGVIMRMRPVPGGLVLPPGRTVTLAPGGYHLMLVGPKRSYKVGERIPATLRFERAGAVKVEFEVQIAPAAGAHMDMH